MVAIGREHQRQNETAETIIRQGVKTLEAINDLRHVPPKESNPAAVPPPPVAKPRSFLDIAPYELGIDSTQGNLFVNVACVNVGPDLIRLLDCGAMVFIHDNTTVGSVNFAVDKAAQEQYFARFIRENKAHVSPRSLIPGNFIWFSPSGPLATPQLIEDLNKNKKTLVVIGQAVYKDDHTVHKNEECEWMQPPVTSPKPVWVPCLVHNGELLSSH